MGISPGYRTAVKLVFERCRLGPYVLLARQGGAWIGVHQDETLRLVQLDIAPKATVGTMFVDAEEWLRRHAKKPMPVFLEAGTVGTEVFLAWRYYGGIPLLDIGKAVRDRGQEPAAETAFAFAFAMLDLFPALAAGPTGQDLIEERRVRFRWDGAAWLDVPTPFELSRGANSAPLTAFAQMPPEQLLGDPLDERSSIYRAATLLLRAWTGRSVVESASDPEVIQRVKAGALDPIKLPEHLPSELVPFLQRGLALDPGARPPTLAAFREELAVITEPFDCGPQAAEGYLRAVFAEECGEAIELSDVLMELTPEAVASWPTFAELLARQGTPPAPGQRHRVPSWWNKMLRR